MVPEAPRGWGWLSCQSLHADLNSLWLLARPEGHVGKKREGPLIGRTGGNKLKSLPGPGVWGVRSTVTHSHHLEVRQAVKYRP